MKKTVSIIALVLCFLFVFGSCGPNTGSSGETSGETQAQTQAPDAVTTAGQTDEQTTPQKPEDTTKIIKIYNAGQLLSLLENSKAENYAETSKNMVYQLQVDIDLNAGWSAEVTANGDTVETLPVVPENIWTGIEKFYGTFDGNGHKISGIYMSQNLEENAVMGFIGELCGGTVKNLTVDNSFFAANVDPEAENVCVGALVGVVNTASVIENVTVNANLHIGGNDGAVVSGTVAKAADGMLTQTGLTFGGKIYRTPADTSVIRVSTAQELLDAIAANGDFEGKTLRLTADIDLNPGWSADVTVGDTIVFPEAPSLVWTPINNFKGVFDGNGHILSGLYVSNTVSGNKGAYGGLFNTLDGGTVQNLVIINSFILTSNPSWGSLNIHVGGIAGDVNTGSMLQTVYMDAEVWFKSNEQAHLGGAFGFVNGEYTVKGFAFVGRIGNTNNEQAPNYATPSGKNMYIAKITACQNWKAGSVTNSLATGEIHTGRNNINYTDRVGVDTNDRLTMKFVANTVEPPEFLQNRTDYRDAGFVYHTGMGCCIPGELVDLLDSTIFAK